MGNLGIDTPVRGLVDIGARRTVIMEIFISAELSSLIARSLCCYRTPNSPKEFVWFEAALPNQWR
jgi:hypothetical protein